MDYAQSLWIFTSNLFYLAFIIEFLEIDVIASKSTVWFLRVFFWGLFIEILSMFILGDILRFAKILRHFISKSELGF